MKKSASRSSAKPLVSIMMGSKSDWPVMQTAAEMLAEFKVGYEAQVISAHRTPDDCAAYAKSLAERGVKAVIAGAGGAAHLPGVVAALTTLPVLGVPLAATPLAGFDSLLAIVQMPKGIPVATFAVGAPGAGNAALFAVALLALEDKKLAGQLVAFRNRQAKRVREARLP